MTSTSLPLTLALTLSTSLAVPAQAAAPRLCVFDIVGATGDAANMAKDYVLAMQKTGVSLETQVYTNEQAAADDFKGGKCQALMATAFRTRAFTPYAGSIDSLGATTVLRDGKVDEKASYEVVRKLVQTYASPQAANLMVENGFEVGGLFPFGAAYPVVKDRKLNSVEALAGKRIAAFDHDKAQALMVQRIGAQPVSSDIGKFAQQFNAGQVDMIAAPTLAYKPLELQKGMGAQGGMARFPLMILTYQVVLRPDAFPAGFGEKSRQHWVGEFDRAMQLIRNADAGIPASAWIELSPEQVQRYNAMLRDSRMEIAAKGIYDTRTLKVIKRVRCATNPAQGECSNPSEEG